jgi:hypothetical protein
MAIPVPPWATCARGHALCQYCEYVLRHQATGSSSSKCPQCQDALPEPKLLPQVAAELVVQRLGAPVPCGFCPASVLLSELGAHRTQCERALERCAPLSTDASSDWGCGLVVSRHLLPDHRRSACPERVVRCPLCRAMLRVRDALREHLLQQHGAVPVRNAPRDKGAPWNFDTAHDRVVDKVPADVLARTSPRVYVVEQRACVCLVELSAAAGLVRCRVRLLPCSSSSVRGCTANVVLYRQRRLSDGSLATMDVAKVVEFPLGGDEDRTIELLLAEQGAPAAAMVLVHLNLYIMTVLQPS